MGFHIDLDAGRASGSTGSDADDEADDPGSISIRLTGWALAANMRRSVIIGHRHVLEASATLRSALEPAIDRRMMGIGPHNGSFRPNRTRIGTMLGRGVDGTQFWAVRASGPELPVLVLDLCDHEFARAVVEIDDPYAVVRALASRGAP